MSPSLENTIVYLWLQLINPGFTLIVKQRYGAELRNRSLASLKPEISQALASLQDELRTIEDTRAMRIGDGFKYKVVTSSRRLSVPHKSCVLCKAAGRMFNSHWSRLVTNDVCEEDEADVYDGDTPENVFSDPAVRIVERDPVSHRVGVVQPHVLYTFYRQHPMAITLDTGATTNMIRASTARVCKLTITPAYQIARQADGVTPLDVIGEIHCNVTRGSLSFQLNALVVKQLDVDVLAGDSFLVHNDVAVRPSKKQIIIGGADIIYYGTDECKAGVASVRPTRAFLLRNPRKTVTLPGDYLELHTPCDVNIDTLWALEPRLDSRTNIQSKPERARPPPQEILSVSGALRVANDTDASILINRGEYICHARQITAVSPADDPDVCSARTRLCSKSNTSYSTEVPIDPDACLTTMTSDRFRKLHSDFDDVFDTKPSLYNGASGKIQAFVDMGPTLPPQRKGTLPSTT